MRQNKASQGLGLIELIIVVAIIGILAAVLFAVPWGGFAVSQAAEVFSREFQFARLEAIRRNEYVGIQVDAGTNAYTFFEDLDRDGTNSAGDTPITHLSGNLSDQGVDIVNVTNATTVFDTRGQILNLAANRVEIARLTGDYPRTICVSRQGRARVLSGSVTC